MLYDSPLNRRAVPRPVWVSSTGVNKPTLERPRRPPPPHVNWLASSTTCLNTSSPTKNLTQSLTNSDSKNPPSLNSKDRLLLWAIPCCQPPRLPPDSPCSPFKFLRRRCCESLLPLSFRWQPNIATFVTRRWREHFPTPPSPPRFATPVRAAGLFPLFCSWFSFH